MIIITVKAKITVLKLNGISKKTKTDFIFSANKFSLSPPERVCIKGTSIPMLNPCTNDITIIKKILIVTKNFSALMYWINNRNSFITV